MSDGETKSTGGPSDDASGSSGSDDESSSGAGQGER